MNNVPRSFSFAAMAPLSGVCFVSSKLLLQNLLFLSSPKRGRRPTRLFFASTSCCCCCCFAEERRRESHHNHPKVYHLTKRMLNLSIVAAAVVILASPTIKVMAEEEDLELQSYTDSKQGFTLLIPPSWIKVDKAGATVLFEEPNKATNNVGVVVNPVRIMNLQQFGTPQFVADKLILAEKRKESTKEAEVIAVSERSGKEGLPVYEFEYKIDSTRGGVKRIFSAAFVASKKLYILNITHFDKPESPLDVHRRRTLEQVLHSFDAVPLT